MTLSKPVKISFIAVIALAILFLFFWLKGGPDYPQQPVVEHGADQFVELDGVKLRYRDEGAADKPVLVLLHGFSYSLESYDALVAELADDFRLIRYDFAGHGLTGPDLQSRYTHADRVRNLRALIRYLKLDRPVLVGNSLGGIAAWRYAAKYPNDTAKLVLLDPGGFPMNGVTDKPVEAPPMVVSYLRNAPKMSVTFAVKRLFADSSKVPDGRIAQVIAMMKQPGNGDAMVAIINNFTLPDPTETLNNIHTPTLILWGAQDTTIPLEHAALFDQAMPNARLLMLDNVGHTPQEEAPKITAAAIRNFMKE